MVEDGLERGEARSSEVARKRLSESGQETERLRTAAVHRGEVIRPGRRGLVWKATESCDLIKWGKVGAGRRAVQGRKMESE